jgi:TRAP-type mannitol/chloroaromatic compound transport system permease small subunit
MNFLLKMSYWIDSMNRGIARVVIWCGLVMIIIAFMNAVLRRVGLAIGENLTWAAAIDLQWYLFSLLFLMVGAYTMLTDSNVRVDVLYTRLSDRKKSIIDIIGCLLFVLPFSALIVYTSWPFVANSLAVMERSIISGGVPPWIIKPIIPIAFLLIMLQALSLLIRHAAFLLGRIPSPYRTGSDHHTGP